MLVTLNGQCHIVDQFNVRFVKFYNCMLKYENTIVKLTFVLKAAPVMFQAGWPEARMVCWVPHPDLFIYAYMEHYPSDFFSHSFYLYL